MRLCSRVDFERTIECWIDGSVDQNPGHIIGWAWKMKGIGIVLHEKGAEEYESGDGTNQKAELTALLELLKFIESPLEHPSRNRNIFERSRFVIYSDSKYVVNCFNGRWYPRANRDIWDPVLKLRDILGRERLCLRWIRGHAGNEGNEAVDKLARTAVYQLAGKLGYYSLK